MKKYLTLAFFLMLLACETAFTDYARKYSGNYEAFSITRSDGSSSALPSNILSIHVSIVRIKKNEVKVTYVVGDHIAYSEIFQINPDNYSMHGTKYKGMIYKDNIIELGTTLGVIKIKKK